MLRKNQKALQMLDGDTWKYVFCISVNMGNKIIFTEDRRKALPVSHNLIWFTEKYSDKQFRGI